jgi:FixJ family two-component response regulator
VPGTIGVVSKPVAEKDLRDVVDYANARRAEAAAQPPRRRKLFDWSDGPAITT